MPSANAARPRRGWGPDVVVHADWSVHPAKRWLAVARRVAGGYEVEAPTLAPRDPVAWLMTRAEQGTMLLGLDVPLGVPEAWGALVGVSSFRELLGILAQGGERAASFFSPAGRPGDIGPWRPFYPARPGGARQAHLLQALGLASMDQLLRRCDRATADRPAAGALFWTLGPKQPGKAAISAWRDVVLPVMDALGDRLGLWPFDGEWSALSSRSVVIAEAYPAELGLRLGLPAPGRGWSKRRQADRVRQGTAMLAWATQRRVGLVDGLRREMEDGFGDGPTGEDRFDAIVGVLGMLAVVEHVVADPTSALGSGGPSSDPSGPLEGWLFGLMS